MRGFYSACAFAIEQETHMKEPILVWDLPTRVFHWLLAASFAGAYLTADADAWFAAHLAFGYAAFGLVAFRLVWGLFGSRYARFRSFSFPWRDTAQYLKSLLKLHPRHYVGHNPAGAWMIYALLGTMLVVVASGYGAFVADSHSLEEVHEAVAFLLLLLVLAHIGGVVVASRMHGENLAAAMVTGRKAGNRRQAIRSRHATLAVLLALATAAIWVSGYQALGTGGEQALLARQDAEQGHEEDDDD